MQVLGASNFGRLDLNLVIITMYIISLCSLLCNHVDYLVRSHCIYSYIPVWMKGLKKNANIAQICLRVYFKLLNMYWPKFCVLTNSNMSLALPSLVHVSIVPAFFYLPTTLTIILEKTSSYKYGVWKCWPWNVSKKGTFKKVRAWNRTSCKGKSN